MAASVVVRYWANGARPQDAAAHARATDPPDRYPMRIRPRSTHHVGCLPNVHLSNCHSVTSYWSPSAKLRCTTCRESATSSRRQPQEAAEKTVRLACTRLLA